MEVIIATALLSVALLTLIQSGNNSINLIEKSKESKKEKEYLQIALDTKEFKKRNENIYLDREFQNLDDDLRRKLKRVKVKIKERIISKEDIKTGDFTFVFNKIQKQYYIVSKDLKKNIYTIEIGF